MAATVPTLTFAPSRREQALLLGIYGAVFAALAVSPYDRDDWLLENSVPFLELLAAAIYFRWVPLSHLSCYLILAHLVIQMIGGHYTYERVPPFNWLRDEFGLARNYYDRIAHFALGFLLYVPIREICLRRTPLRYSRNWACFFAVMTIAAIGGLWEVFEWIVAALAHPELGAAYLGLQGDTWDAQKDIILAVVGALAAAPIFHRLHDRLIADAPRKAYGPIG